MLLSVPNLCVGLCDIGFSINGILDSIVASLFRSFKRSPRTELTQLRLIEIDWT